MCPIWSFHPHPPGWQTGPGTPAGPVQLRTGCAGLRGGPLGLPGGRMGDLVLTEQLPCRHRFSLVRVHVQHFCVPLAPPKQLGPPGKRGAAASHCCSPQGGEHPPLALGSVLAVDHPADLIPFPFVTCLWRGAGVCCCMCCHLAFAAEFL